MKDIVKSALALLFHTFDQLNTESATCVILFEGLFDRELIRAIAFIL